jgi:hypothetical protein
MPGTNGQPSGHSCSPRPYSPDLAMSNFYLFGRLKRQLYGRTMDSEPNLLETVTQILNESSKNERKNVFLHRKKDIIRSPTMMDNFSLVIEMLRCFDIISVD